MLTKLSTAEWMLHRLLLVFLLIVLLLPVVNSYELITQCSDGIDNDDDGTIDCYDLDCPALCSSALMQTSLDGGSTPIRNEAAFYEMDGSICELTGQDIDLIDVNKVSIYYLHLQSCEQISQDNFILTFDPVDLEEDYIPPGATVVTSIANTRAYPSCQDGVANQNEDTIDCGGVCGSDCRGYCHDGVMNQDETAIDCGGVCGECAYASYRIGYAIDEEDFAYKVNYNEDFTNVMLSARIENNLIAQSQLFYNGFMKLLQRQLLDKQGRALVENFAYDGVQHTIRQSIVKAYGDFEVGTYFPPVWNNQEGFLFKSSSFDALDRLIATQSGDGSGTTYLYDASSVLTETNFDDTGRILRKKEIFDASNNPLEIIEAYQDPLETHTAVTYDVFGRPLSIVNDKGHEYRKIYDSVGRVLQSEHPDKGDESFTYDVLGRLVEHTKNNLVRNSGFEYVVSSTQVPYWQTEHDEPFDNLFYGSVEGFGLGHSRAYKASTSFFASQKIYVLPETSYVFSAYFRLGQEGVPQNAVVEITNCFDETGDISETPLAYEEFSVEHSFYERQSFTFTSEEQVTCELHLRLSSPADDEIYIDNVMLEKELMGNVQAPSSYLATFFTYDVLGRLVLAKQSDGFYSTNVYDDCENGIGKLCLRKDQSGSREFSYGSDKNIATENIVVVGKNLIENPGFERQPISSYGYDVSTTYEVIPLSNEHGSSTAVRLARSSGIGYRGIAYSYPIEVIPELTYTVSAYVDGSSLQGVGTGLIWVHCFREDLAKGDSSGGPAENFFHFTEVAADKTITSSSWHQYYITFIPHNDARSCTLGVSFSPGSTGELTIDELSFVRGSQPEFVENEPMQFSYEFTYNNLIKKRTYADGTFVLYEYDALQNIDRVIYFDGEESSELLDLEYTERNMLDSLQTENVFTQFSYHPRGFLESIETLSDGERIFSEGLDYNYYGDVVALYDAPTFDQSSLLATYSYDALNRLVDVSDQGYYGGNVHYSFDSVGNILTMTEAGEQKTFLYDQGLVNNKVTSVDETEHTVILAYDNRGNIVQQDNFHFNYDANNLLRSIYESTQEDEPLSFVSANLYDAGKRLVRKESLSLIERNYYDYSGKLLHKISDRVGECNVGQFASAEPKFIIENDGGELLFVADKNGIVLLKGMVRELGDEQPDGGDFTIENAAGEVVFWIDGVSGDVFTNGLLFEHSALTAEHASFIVENDEEEPVVLFDMVTGDIKIKNCMEEHFLFS
ncbi:MAG: hypothetical protein H6502_00020 [Candidatus Woesearchaeota archaeon]|nr:MAG: hypothetical protein H6502_00020 [Candidatus Woesearchaeota archaeon]